MPLTPGDTLFEYRIVCALGQGAFGTVYLAQDTLLDRPVAIKELTAAAQADRAAFQRFLQEARAAGSLNHPNIVTIYALKPADTTVYLVMEYLPGGSLRGLLSQRDRLPVDDAVRIATDVCDGLAAAHAKGIVHRDIKPENILLTADGRAKVCDFGIAHVPRTDGGAYVGGLAQTGFQPGTLIYMSPEQILGQAVDGRSDVYQVGALLYEMLAGRHYIDVEALTRRAQETAGGNLLRAQARLYDLLEEAICKQEPQYVRRVRLDVPSWLGAAVTAMLARQVMTRPTAADLVKTLRYSNSDGLLGQAIRGTQLEKGKRRRPSGSSQGEQQANLKTSLPSTAQQAISLAPSAALKAGTVHRNQKIAKLSEDRGDGAIQKKDDFAQQESLVEAGDHVNLGNAFVFQALRAASRSGAAADHVNRDDAFPKQGHADEAIRMFQATLRINPDDAEAHYNLGNVYSDQGRTEEAIHEYQATLRIDPDHANAHNGLGGAIGEQGRINDAIQEFRAALRIDPNHVSAYSNLGGALLMQGCIDDAIQEFYAALRIAPNHAAAHSNLGAAFLKQGRVDEAVVEFQVALQNDPDCASARNNLGAAFVQQGRLVEAIWELRAALWRDPADAEAHYNLSKVYARQGHPVKARREARKALLLGFEPARQLMARQD